MVLEMHQCVVRRLDRPLQSNRTVLAVGRILNVTQGMHQRIGVFQQLERSRAMSSKWS